jgi:hypothetical protein
MHQDWVHPEFANTSLCNLVSHSRANGNLQRLGFYIDSHLRGSDTDICKSEMLPQDSVMKVVDRVKNNQMRV